ncbi:hypothetical protein [Aeromonas hydrophila]|uniref:hypothetical protein n=1 Tax=Aeromonas hydrophila TaxID=644 RepID=UPI0020B2F12D|nr:hypothetical protein [Aeromonas hydrophila]CAD7536163.1 hypothetical protein KBAHV42_24140 [Aeromonas hydrophila]
MKMNGGSFTTDSASAAGKKSVEARRRNKVIKDQYYLALAGKADELVTAFTAGGTVLGVNLPNDARARIIEQVVAQVMGGSMINAVRHNSEVDLLLLKDELKRDETRYEDPTQGDDMTVAYMTVAELMAKEGSVHIPVENEHLFRFKMNADSGLRVHRFRTPQSTYSEVR